jgi:hypothetical protein
LLPGTEFGEDKHATGSQTLLLSIPYAFTEALDLVLPDTKRPTTALPHASSKPTTLLRQDYDKSVRIFFPSEKSTRLGLTPTRKTSTAFALQHQQPQAPAFTAPTNGNQQPIINHQNQIKAGNKA